jgi:hypothetical protein
MDEGMTDRELLDKLKTDEELNEHGYRKVSCSKCHGLGHVVSDGDTGVMQWPCYRCDGRGYHWLPPMMRSSSIAEVSGSESAAPTVRGE